MNLNKIVHRVEFENEVEKILQSQKISKESFLDLSRLHQITRSTTNIWYCYQSKVIFNYFNQLNHNKHEYVLLSKNQLKYLIMTKYQYYKDYQEEIINLEIQIYRKELATLQILGQYYAEYDYQYACVERIDNNANFMIMSEAKLKDTIISKKYQSNKELIFSKKLSKNNIQNFILCEIELY